MKQRKLRLKVWLTRDFWGNAAPVAVGSMIAGLGLILRLFWGIDITSELKNAGILAIVGLLILVMAPTMLIMLTAPRFFAKRRLGTVKRRLARLSKRLNAYDGPQSMGRTRKGLPRDGRSPDMIMQDLRKLLQKQDRYREELRMLKTYVRRISKPLAWI